jgi:hypothetical protein
VALLDRLTGVSFRSKLFGEKISVELSYLRFAVLSGHFRTVSRRISRGSLSSLNPADVSVSYGRKRERKLERNKKNQPAKGWLLSCPSVSLFVPLNTKIMDRGSDVLFFSLLSVIVAELYN